MIKKIALLGSTGSIGVNALKVIRAYPERYKIIALAAGRNIKRLLQQIEEFRPLAVSVLEEAITPDFNWARMDSTMCVAGNDDPDCLTLSHAFFPLYPGLARIVATPFRLLGMEPIASSTLAAVLVSGFGALVAMLSKAFFIRPPRNAMNGEVSAIRSMRLASRGAASSAVSPPVE